MTTKNIAGIIAGIIVLVLLFSFGKNAPQTGMNGEEGSETATTTVEQAAVTPKKPVSSAGATQVAAPVIITISQFKFPPIVRVKKGTTVTWVNKDQGPHDVVSEDGANTLFNSGLIKTNESFSYTFNKIGSVAYHSSFHPEMKGTIVVAQ